MNNSISTVSATNSVLTLGCEVRQNFHAFVGAIAKNGTSDEIQLSNALNAMSSQAYKDLINGETYAAKDLAAAARCLVIGAGDMFNKGIENRKAWNNLMRSNTRLEMQIDRETRA